MKNIIINEFRKFFRNPFMLVCFLIFPIIMIYLLGNLVENVQTCDETIGNIKVAYTAQDVDFGSLYQNDDVQFLPMEQTEGQAKLNDGQVNGYFKIDEAGLTLFEGSSVLYNSVVKGIANGYLLQKSVYESIVKDNPVAMANIHMSEEDHTVKKEANASMTMFDYYAVAMSIMTALYAAMASSMVFTEERKYKTMNRLITSPMNKFKIFSGICIGQIPFVILQFVVLLSFSAIAFHANYAPTFLGKVLLFLLLIVTGVLFSILGVVISLVFRKSMAVPIFLIVWVSLLLSGCFAKAMTLEPICNFLPPYLVRQAAFSLNVFGDHGPAIRVILVEVAIIIGLILVGGLIFSKKQEERV
ncbi:MAG: ABC transporter permease [Clostridiales bacterium]|nr:ABC transporter permease [Clostridiales bacterium]